MLQRTGLQRNVQCLVGIAFLLTIIGLIFIYSASSIFALERYGSAQYFLKRQLLFLIPAFIAFVISATISLSWLQRRAPLIFLGSLFLMGLSLSSRFSGPVHGAKRWLWGFSGQPSEFLKVCALLYLGFFLERKQVKLTSFFQSYLPFLLVLSACFLFLYYQPDFGTIITLSITAMCVFFVAEFRLVHLVVTIACSLPLVGAAIVFAPYRLKRILIFLNPWSDPHGRGYQIIQSLIAIGSGAWAGLGIGNSKQKFFYLPMQHTDFIFSIIAEEVGFLGSCLILFLFAAFFYCGIKIVAALDDRFAFFTALGFIVLISLQTVINLMVVSGLVPTKGLSLPFVSYGGSSLVANYTMLGLIVNFARAQRHQFLRLKQA